MSGPSTSCEPVTGSLPIWDEQLPSLSHSPPQQCVVQPPVQHTTHDIPCSAGCSNEPAGRVVTPMPDSEEVSITIYPIVGQLNNVCQCVILPSCFCILQKHLWHIEMRCTWMLL